MPAHREPGVVTPLPSVSAMCDEDQTASLTCDNSGVAKAGFTGEGGPTP